MKRCMHCGQKTLATIDWACPWCGYPLHSPKRLEKTYAEIIAERRGANLYPEYATTEEFSIPEPEKKNQPAASERKDEKPAVQDEEPEPILVTQDEEEYLNREPTVDEPEPAEQPSPGPPEAEEAIQQEEAEEAVEQAEPEQVIPEEETGSVPETQAQEAEEDMAEMSLEEAMAKIPSVIQEMPIYITVEELLSSYQADDKEADAKYNNRLLRLSGTVAMVNIKDMRDFQYIILCGEDQNIFQSIKCIFDPQFTQQLTELQKGTAVNILGRFKGSLTAMSLVDCSIE